MPKECRTIEKFLLSSIEDTLGPSQLVKLKLHLEVCGSCQRRFEDLQAIWKALDTWEPEPAPPALRPVLLQRARDLEAEKDRPVPQVAGVLRYLKPAASALLLMLGALLGYVLGHHPDASAQTAVAARPETVAVEETYIAAYLEDFQDVPQRSLSDLYLNSRILPEEEKP